MEMALSQTSELKTEEKQRKWYALNNSFRYEIGQLTLLDTPPERNRKTVFTGKYNLSGIRKGEKSIILK